MLWQLLPPNRRREAFFSSASERRRRQLGQVNVPSELRDALTKLVRIVDVAVDEAEVSAACNAAGDWARASGALYCELAFRQAAALAQPRDVALALAVARLARDLNQMRRAETWFRRTIKAARLGKQWELYIRAYLGLGTMYNRLGNGPAAKAVMERALNAARRQRLRQLAGEAHHDLFHVWVGLRDLRRAYEHASSARSCYADAHQHLVRLAADLGILSIKVGTPGRAIPLLQLVIPQIPDPNIGAMLLAQLTRAAAELQNRPLYEAVRRDFYSASDIRDPWHKAECHAILASADLAMLERERAREEAMMAAKFAEQVSATEIKQYAETIIALIASADDGTGLRTTALPETPGVARFADRLADELCAAVSG